ncbi:NAD-dependent dehydratase, partial [Pseudomonas sp. MWU13-2625]
YAADKLASEYYLVFYRRQHGLEPVILRFFNIYGPRQDPSSPYSGVISIFSERAKAGRPITLFGDGGQTRDFVYVADLVKILVQGLECPAPAAAATNVGLGGVTTLNDLLGALQPISGNPPQVTPGATRSCHIRHSNADNPRFRARLHLATPSSLAARLAQPSRSPSFS